MSYLTVSFENISKEKNCTFSARFGSSVHTFKCRQIEEIEYAAKLDKYVNLFKGSKVEFYPSEGGHMLFVNGILHELNFTKVNSKHTVDTLKIHPIAHPQRPTYQNDIDSISNVVILPCTHKDVDPITNEVFDSKIEHIIVPEYEGDAEIKVNGITYIKLKKEMKVRYINLLLFDVPSKNSKKPLTQSANLYDQHGERICHIVLVNLPNDQTRMFNDETFGINKLSIN